jgi:hypothetical protein
MRINELFETNLDPINVDALKQELVAKQAEFERLGGMSYQYADRMMPQDYQAQQVHREINSLERRIQAAGG